MALVANCAACRQLFYIREGFYEHCFPSGIKVYVHKQCYENQFGENNDNEVLYE